MASPIVKWEEFVNGMGWGSNVPRETYPFHIWEKEKIELIDKKVGLVDLVVEHETRWHFDVLKTLKQYPAVNDALMALVIKKIDGLKSQGWVDPDTLKTLASTIKILTESKHKSLLINDWSMKLAEKYKGAIDPNAEVDGQNKFKHRDSEKLSQEKMREALVSYYDKPQDSNVIELNKEENGSGSSDHPAVANGGDS